MNPTEVLRQAGYCLPAPIPRSPTIQLPEVDITDVPSPYCYHLILVPEHEREAIREKFIHDCNQKRFRHILQAEIPKGKNHVPKPANTQGSGVARKAT